jgi:hypothetical protein
VRPCLRPAVCVESRGPNPNGYRCVKGNDISLSGAWLDKSVSSLAAVIKPGGIDSDSGIVIRGWQLQMSLEIRLQQIPFKLSGVEIESAFKKEFAARKQAFDLVADVPFKPAGVESRPGPPFPGRMPCLPPRLPRPD